MKFFVDKLVETSDNKYLVVGNFTGYDGTSINRMVRLNTDGTIDGTFNIGTGFNADVDDVIETSDGKYLVGGSFTQYNGDGHNRIIKLDTDGSVIW